jgi:hypothetical protein
MSDRYKKCLPAVLSRSLKDVTMFHPWMKVSFTVSNFLPKNSDPIGKVGEAAGMMDVMFI